MVDALVHYRKHFLIAMAIGVLMLITIISYSSGTPRNQEWQVVYLGAASLAYVPLFLFIVTEAFGPFSTRRKKANTILARILSVPSGFVALGSLYGFVNSLLWLVL
jgi:hypothetical protein